MNVGDYAPADAGKRVLNLREKGGKRHRVSAHHKLREMMDSYLGAAGIWEGKDEPLFRAANRSKELKENRLIRQRALEVVKRRPRQADIEKTLPLTRIHGPPSSTTGATSASGRGRSKE